MPTPKPFRFGLLAPRLTTRKDLQDFARGIEGDGWSTLLMADHLGLAASLPPLVSVADVTTTLRVGTLVLNNDFHRPVSLAQEIATVDRLTDGRLEIGLGSGWSKPEYEILDIAYDKPIVRARRLIDAWGVMTKAWEGQPTLTFGGGEIPASPAPHQRPHPPLLVGGNGDTILRFAAQEADIVGLTGTSWRGGAMRQTGASLEAFAERVAFVRDAAGDRFDQLELNVQVGTVTTDGDLEGALAEAAARAETTPEVIRDSPLYLIGSRSEVVEKIQRLREELGLSYFASFGWSRAALTPVVAELAGR
ncbi:MAG: TIGR03621 family F420-dependent LLM class oxidoreductase [Acidimicrobiaceae bacterium]|nr:TIGR03621 family F420-dependent LLM class oxidoreductase [Acidimicrobiaceae bacterium]